MRIKIKILHKESIEQLNLDLNFTISLEENKIEFNFSNLRVERKRWVAEMDYTE